jgi:hypothetical protein
MNFAMMLAHQQGIKKERVKDDMKVQEFESF